MKQLKKWWPLLLLAVTLLAIMMLAAGLSTDTLRPSEPFPTWIFQDMDPGELPIGQAASKEIEPLAAFWRTLIVTFLLGLLILWLITFIFRPEARKRLLARLAGYTVLLLIVYAFYSRFQNLQLPSGDGDDVEIGLDGEFLQDQPPLPPLVNEPPAWLVTIVTLVIIAVVLGLVWWLWQRYRSRYQSDPAALLAREARHAVKTLEAGSNFKDTVTRCYRDMSLALSEQQGIHRQKAMTPREFEAHLAEIGLRDEHIKRLTRLFESVRYGANTASERDKREAMDCLNAIVQVYGGSA